MNDLQAIYFRATHIILATRVKNLHLLFEKSGISLGPTDILLTQVRITIKQLISREASIDETKSALQ